MTSDDAGRGVDIAQAAIRAHAVQDSAELLRIINAASHAELAWACGYLVSALGESVLVAANGDQKKARRMLWAAASNREDAVFTEALAILADAEHNEPREEEE